MIDANDVTSFDHVQPGLVAAKQFMPEARRIFKAETGKTVSNVALQRVLMEFYKKLQNDSHD